VKNDATTVSFDYVDPTSAKSPKERGLMVREKSQFDEDSIGGLSVESK